MEQVSHYAIFYSWQSDLPKRQNEYFIQKCLEKAIKKLTNDESITVVPRIEQDTSNSSGSPGIAETIFIKIDACQIFVADVSIINNNWLNKLFKKRLTPNPNVLIELGYATYRLSWERIICVHNNAFGKVESLPFDIRSQRISQYSYDGKTNLESAQENLTGILYKAVKTIVKQYPALEEKQRSYDTNQHDRAIFRGFNDIVNDTHFRDMLQEFANNLMVFREEYRLLDKMAEYLDAESTQFMNKVIRTDSASFYAALREMHMTLATNLFSSKGSLQTEDPSDPDYNPVYQLPEMEGFKNMEEYYQNRDLRIDRITAAISECLAQYRKFRATVKTILFI